MNSGNRWGILCLYHRLFKGISPCKMDQINADLKGNWCWLARKKIDKQLYMDQSIKVTLDQGRQEEKLDGCCLSPILFSLYSECITNEAVEGFGHFKVRRASNLHCEIHRLLCAIG
jgi:hypothetical protein